MVRDDAEIVGDEQDAHAVSRLQPSHQRQDLRLDRHVERGRRLVGDQQRRVARHRERDHHALAHAARELVRVLVQALRGGRDLHQLQHAQRLGAAPPRGPSPLCSRSDLGDLLADGEAPG